MYHMTIEYVLYCAIWLFSFNETPGILKVVLLQFAISDHNTVLVIWYCINIMILISAYMCIYMYVCIYVHICIYICIYIYMYVCMCMYVYMHTYVCMCEQGHHPFRKCLAAYATPSHYLNKKWLMVINVSEYGSRLQTFPLQISFECVPRWCAFIVCIDLHVLTKEYYCCYPRPPNETYLFIYVTLCYLNIFI